MRQSVEVQLRYLDESPTRRELREIVFVLQEMMMCQINLRATLIAGDPNSPLLTGAEAALEASHTLQAIVRRMMNAGVEDDGPPTMQ
ncbi:hypothetical protein [Sphingomonas sp. IW22]|uniref:hypothetical protein n=1 Tax=Sphingomonas sp. IW22 TaxID=3242489 RepID=UPI00351FBF82